jgi:hypothetical protein
MSKLAGKMVKFGKQKQIPAKIIDVLGPLCSVKLSGNGEKLTGLSYVGPTPVKGQKVIVNYQTGTPFVQTGSTYAAAEYSAPATPSPSTYADGTDRSVFGSVHLDKNGMGVWNDDIPTGQISTDGDSFFGSNLDYADNTSLSIFTNAQSYNGESMGAGDLLVGSNSSGFANVFWDASAKQLKFRGGTTVQAYVATDGTIVAGGGNVVLSTTGISASAGTIGGWTLGANSLSATGAVISAAVPSIALGGAGYRTGTGFWVGKDVDSVFKFFIGDSVIAHKQYMYFDGVNLVITGTYSGEMDISGVTSNTFTINSDLTDATAQLIFGRTTGGNASIGYDGNVLTSDKTINIATLNEGVYYTLQLGSSDGTYVVSYADDALNNLWVGGNVTTVYGDSELSLQSAAQITLYGTSVYAGEGTPFNLWDDIIVGDYVFFVDVSQGNVGFNTEPDPQFVVDIGGNARVQGYLSAKMAMTVKDVLMICHFDGHEPYAIDFSGDPGGHRGQVATVVGGVQYRPGKFYKAVQLAEATTNLVPNPNLGTNTTGWQWQVNAQGSGYGRITNEQVLYGNTCGKAVCSGTGSRAVGTNGYWTRPAGADVTISIYVKPLTHPILYTMVAFSDNWAQNQGSSPVTVPVGEWTRLTLSISNATLNTWHNGGLDLTFFLIDNNDGVAETWLFGAAQMEAGMHATPYQPSDLLETNHRDASHLQYSPEGNINLDAGSFGMTYYNFGYLNDYPLGLYVVIDSNNYIAQYFNAVSGGTPYVYVNSGGSGVVAGEYAPLSIGWHQLIATWKTGELLLYIDGELVSNAVYTRPVGTPSIMYLGYGNANVLIDDFFTVDRVMEPDEIRAVYDSDAPIFAETSVSAWRSSRHYVWMDDEGLWAQHPDGSNVFAISTSDGKSYSGGTMDWGDLLIGTEVSGIYWDYSEAKIQMWEAQLSLSGETGSISIGDDPPVSCVDGTGLWIDKDGIYGLSKTGAVTTLEAKFDAITGKIMAGSGVVVMDSNGITITPAISENAYTNGYKFINTLDYLEGLFSYSASDLGVTWTYLTLENSSPYSDSTYTYTDVVAAGDAAGIVVIEANDTAGDTPARLPGAGIAKIVLVGDRDSDGSYIDFQISVANVPGDSIATIFPTGPVFNGGKIGTIDFTVSTLNYDAIFVDSSANSIEIMHNAAGYIGFFAKDPVVQPIATTDLGTVLSDLGLRAAGTAYPITTSGAISMTGSTIALSKITTYNTIATANNGVASEIYSNTWTSQTAAIGATTLYAVPASGGGYYRVTWFATVTTASSGGTPSSTLGGSTGFQLKYTVGGVVKTTTPVAVTSMTSTTNNTATAAVSGVQACYCDASTNLQFLFGYTSAGTSPMQYRISVIVEKL